MFYSCLCLLSLLVLESVESLEYRLLVRCVVDSRQLVLDHLRGCARLLLCFVEVFELFLENEQLRLQIVNAHVSVRDLLIQNGDAFGHLSSECGYELS